MSTPETTPVIVAIGEFTERPKSVQESKEPVALMVEAMRGADADGGGKLLARLDSIELVGLVSWRYADAVGLLCEKLGIAPTHKVNAGMGGETPIRLVHEAALRVARGESKVAAVVGGESNSSRTKAKRENVELPWTPMPPPKETPPFFTLSEVAKKLRMWDPAQIYPFYEMALEAAEGKTPQQGNTESAHLWAKFAASAATNPYAWNKDAANEDAIGTVSADNRMINWPYPKLMVANPSVNQAAAVIVTSLALARELGIADEKCVHIWGGAAAHEPDDYLARDSYAHSTAQAAVLNKASAIAGGAKKFSKLELYSCFPVVPKLALKTLGLDADKISPTVTGGLTFFGGPLNDYMLHAVCAMTREMRADPKGVGLLYGNGGYVNKHHAIVVSQAPAKAGLDKTYSVQAEADAKLGPVPKLREDYTGPAKIETYTVTYARDGGPIEGIVIALTPQNERVMARVPADDEASLALLLSWEKNAVGQDGHVRIDAFGKPAWSAGTAKKRERKYCTVEREGPLTIVTINRPDSMNSVHPMANAELAEVFDEFSADPDQWVAIITGAGDRAFSSGNDLKYTAQAMARGLPTESPLAGFGGLSSRYDLDKPVIAAVNGVAMGGGFEIALACDIIIASDQAKFALPEPKVGLAALAGGLLRLPRQIGEKQAMGMILTGRTVSPEEGKALGFVNEVVPHAQLMDVAHKWAADILACSPMSIRASKQIVRKGLEASSVQEAYSKQMSYPATRALFASDDVREGPLAFAQKRKPNWRGK
ncbi:MAG: enoyl-CoA hydratase-related protein [Terricaulis sp.]